MVIIIGSSCRRRGITVLDAGAKDILTFWAGEPPIFIIQKTALVWLFSVIEVKLRL